MCIRDSILAVVDGQLLERRIDLAWTEDVVHFLADRFDQDGGWANVKWIFGEHIGTAIENLLLAKDAAAGDTISCTTVSDPDPRIEITVTRGL